MGTATETILELRKNKQGISRSKGINRCGAYAEKR